MIRIFFFVGTAVLLTVMACTKDRVIVQPVPEPECMEAVNYTLDVGPIIQQNCSTTGCHDASASGGYNLSTYQDVSQSAETVLSVIRHDPGVLPMPYDSPKLPDSLIQKVECWIVQGKPEN